MTEQEVRIALDEIRQAAAERTGYEEAHLLEDHLYKSVLGHLATHAASLEDRALCAAALEAKDIEFRRYYA